MKLRMILGAMVVAGALFALAQDEAGGATTVAVGENDTLGSYLTDSEGRTLYLFVNDDVEAGPERMTEGVREGAVSCTGGCLENWPPITGEVVAGEGIDEELLYTAEFDGMTMVVYNGWPLYYFARDAEAGQINGQGLGPTPRVWYIISPDGQPIRGDG